MNKLLPLLLLFPLLLAAEDEKLAELVTLDGKFYQDVTIRKVEPDGLSILHKSGTAKVSFEQLPASMQEKYGYDAEAAAAHRKAEAEAQRKREAAEKAAGKKQAAAAKDKAAEDAKKELSEQIQKAGKMVKIEAIQNAPIGLIGEISVGTLTSEPVKSKMGSTVGQKPVWRYRNRAIDGVIAGTEGARVKTSSDDTAVPYGGRSVTTESIFWEGKAWRVGMIEYTTLRGLTLTRPYYTASEEDAAAFYKTNGFSPKSDNVVWQPR